MTHALAAEFFRQLGATTDDVDRMLRYLRVPPFPIDELPIHPGVARHFRLDYGGDDHRYAFMNEGYFTFQEFALRYMRCAWNAALEEGLHLFHSRDYDAAIERLSAALAESPRSARGHNAMRFMLEARGDLPAALRYARQAVASEPAAASYRAALAHLLARTGSHEAAVEEYRRAVELDPGDAHHATLFAHCLCHAGRMPEAIACLRHVIEAEPFNPRLRVHLSELLEASGNLAEAVEAQRGAVALGQGVTEF